MGAVTVTEPLVLPGELTLVLESAADSIAGPRPDNQDAGLAAARVVAVADGVGGSAGGATAAGLVIDRLRASADLARPDAPDLVGSVEAATGDLAAALAGDPALEGMATTLTAAALTSGGRLVLAHVGDSRAYLLRRGELIRLTTDHSLVQALIDSGAITPEQARTHPLRSVVLAALHGRAEDLAGLAVSALPVQPGDRLLLCSDGLSGAVPEQTLREVLAAGASPADTVRRLLQTALARSTQDNATAVVADVGASVGGPALPTAVVGAARTLRRRP
jgi:serine/threonine protein phosphatase PrpC